MADYIERKAVIEFISQWYRKACRSENMNSYNMGERAAYKTAISEIVEIPAADVRPVVRGNWEDCTEYNGEYRCSVCKEFEGHKRNFCPNCGAEMR